MTLPDWLKEALSHFEQKKEPHNEAQIVDALDSARKPQGDLSDEDFKAYVVERSAFFFRAHAGDRSVWGTRFGPMAEWTMADGTAGCEPNIAKFDGSAVSHWEERAHFVESPVMRARYADLAWDLARTITGKRPSYKLAQIAIDAYLQSVSQHYFTIEFEAIMWLKGALDLALSIRDNDRIGRVVSEILSFSAHLASNQQHGVCFIAFDELYGKKELLTPEQEAGIIADLETNLTRTSGSPSPTFDPFIAEAVAERLGQHYRRVNDRASLVRVMKAYGDAVVLLSTDAAPMLATAWLQRVIERFEQEGMKEESEQIQLIHAEKAKNISSDFKEYAATVTIERSKVEEQVELLIAGDYRSALLKIATFFLPNVELTRQFLERMRVEAPIISSITIDFVARDGHTGARVNSGDEDDSGRLHMQLARLIGIYQPLLRETLERLKSRYSPSVEDILTVLKESPIYSQFDTRLLHDGLDAYQNEDFVKAISVLVPQIEHLLRKFLGTLGIPLLKPVRNHPEIMDAKSLNDVLIDERMRRVLTERLWRYLTVLFIEKRGGLNLRNDLAHGLFPMEEFNQQVADRVFHAILALSLVRAAVTDVGESSHSPEQHAERGES
jgi:lysyl-tRNA synthetase class 1